MTSPKRAEPDRRAPLVKGTPAVSTLDLGRSVIMGVVNVTPDSFSDGGLWIDPGAAVAHCRTLIADGADILDIGGESTRPGAEPVDAETQLARVLPVIAALRAAADTRHVVISVDTTSAVVAAAAIAAGADIINDISAFTFDSAMLPLLAETDVAAVAMHTTGPPKSMQHQLISGDIVATVASFLRGRVMACEAAGVDPTRLILDPGIGFGKTGADNIALLRATPTFVALGHPLLLGVSRKRFIGDITGRAPADREFGTAGAISVARALGAHIFRVHDVRAMRDALRVVDALTT